MDNKKYTWYIWFYYDNSGMNYEDTVALDIKLGEDIIVLKNITSKLLLVEHAFYHGITSGSTGLHNENSTFFSDNYPENVIKVRLQSDNARYSRFEHNVISIIKSQWHNIAVLNHEIMHFLAKKGDPTLDIHNFKKTAEFCLNSWYTHVKPWSIMLKENQRTFLNNLDSPYVESDVDRNMYPIDFLNELQLANFKCCRPSVSDYIITGINENLDVSLDMRQWRLIEESILESSCLTDNTDNSCSTASKPKSISQKNIDSYNKNTNGSEITLVQMKQIVGLAEILVQKRKIDLLKSNKKNELISLYEKTAMYITKDTNIGYEFYFDKTVQGEIQMAVERISSLENQLEQLKKPKSKRKK